MEVSDNELIAEFMGMKRDHTEHEEGMDHHWTNSPKGQHWAFDDPPFFDKSWDWLMPVVERIEALPEHPLYKKYRFDVAIKGKSCEISFARLSKGEPGHNYFEAKTKIKAVYKSVIDFIKWYNQQPKP